MHAGDRILVSRAACHYLVNEFTVTTKAGILQYLRIVRFYHDGLMKVLERKAFGVVIAIDRLCDELFEWRMGQVTIGAGCHDMVAGLHPRIVLVVHDVAVRTGLGIGREVGKPLGVNECK